MLYKLSVLQREFGDGDKSDPFVACSPKLIHLSLDVLLKTQSDDVRLNCVGLSTSVLLASVLKSLCFGLCLYVRFGNWERCLSIIRSTVYLLIETIHLHHHLF